MRDEQLQAGPEPRLASATRSRTQALGAAAAVSMLAVSMLAASLWAGSLALGLESSASAQRGSGLNWVPGANGQVPQNAVSGGQERGRQLFVCRARYQGGVHPGKIVGRNCNIGYGGREITVPRYEVLTSTRPNRISWQAAANGQIPPGAVVGGQEPGRQLYICRAPYQGGVHPGKLVGRNCNIGWGGNEVTLPRYEVMVLASRRPQPNPPPVVVPPASSMPTFRWSSAGPIRGMVCTQTLEPADPHTWSDNYFCASQDIGMRWSYAGPIRGMECTQILETADPHTWSDNYLCLPRGSSVSFRWSSAGPIRGMQCVQWLETADPHTWSDNYLCYSGGQAPPPPPAPSFRWSSAGPIRGMVCTQTLEPADPHTWSDNYFCANQDIGMRWSYAGPIRGMECTQILETADPHTWSDNYLCVPRRSSVSFRWSSAGPIRGMQCVQWLETADPHTWSDNYLCY